MYTIYAVYNQKHKKIYIGQTADLTTRVRMHNDGTFSTSYTARFDGVWTVIYSEEVSSREEALRREKQLKSFRGREFVKTHIPG